VGRAIYRLLKAALEAAGEGLARREEKWIGMVRFQKRVFEDDERARGASSTQFPGRAYPMR
jgi:hypothetical protein